MRFYHLGLAGIPCYTYWRSFELEKHAALHDFGATGGVSGGDVGALKDEQLVRWLRDLVTRRCGHMQRESICKVEQNLLKQLVDAEDSRGCFAGHDGDDVWGPMAKKCVSLQAYMFDVPSPSRIVRACKRAGEASRDLHVTADFTSPVILSFGSFRLAPAASKLKCL